MAGLTSERTPHGSRQSLIGAGTTAMADRTIAAGRAQPASSPAPSGGTRLKMSWPVVASNLVASNGVATKGTATNWTGQASRPDRASTAQTRERWRACATHCGPSGRASNRGGTTGLPRRWSVMASGQSGRALTLVRAPTSTTGGARPLTGTGSAPSERASSRSVPAGTGIALVAAHSGVATACSIGRAGCTPTACLIGRASCAWTVLSIGRAGYQGRPRRAVPGSCQTELPTAAIRSRQAATVRALLGTEAAPFPVIGTRTGRRRQCRATAMTTR